AKNVESSTWNLLLEFEIPRRGKRPDVILLASDVIFIIEFKIGGRAFEGGDRWQVLSYALDLRDFHAASLNRFIVPVLVATHVSTCGEPTVSADSCLVQPVQCTSGDAQGLATLIIDLQTRLTDRTCSPIDADSWEQSPYRPTPTIIEASQNVFSG